MKLWYKKWFITFNKNDIILRGLSSDACVCFFIQEAHALVAKAFQYTVKVLQDNKDKLHKVILSTPISFGSCEYV